MTLSKIMNYTCLRDALKAILYASLANDFEFVILSSDRWTCAGGFG